MGSKMILMAFGSLASVPILLVDGVPKSLPDWVNLPVVAIVLYAVFHFIVRPLMTQMVNNQAVFNTKVNENLEKSNEILQKMNTQIILLQEKVQNDLEDIRRRIDLINEKIK